MLLKSWQCRGEDSKEILKTTRTKIQDDFRKKAGLLVDRPKPGFGNSNDGNTARKFFGNPLLSSEITGVDIEIIERFAIILQVISSTEEIDIQKFGEYTNITAQLLIEKYPWYPMSPTVHKILVHGKAIIQNALVPIGQLSEEAQEARNKEFRRFRENHSRKFSRVATNQDLLNSLLISSDPLITSLRKDPKRKTHKLLENALPLLKNCSRKEDSSNDEDSTYSDCFDEN